jgi:DNA-binding CsgD family transcriptional regulator
MCGRVAVWSSAGSNHKVWLEPRASRAVLVAAGHGEPRTILGKRQQNPGGLTRREVDVLRLAAKGLTARQIGDRVCISPKTADHHIQHLYGKIGVSTRGPPLCGPCNTPSSSDRSPNGELCRHRGRGAQGVAHEWTIRAVPPW